MEKDNIGFTHISPDGMPKMVDISEKKVTKREARAYGKVVVPSNVFEAIKENYGKKGNILEVAKLAGIMGAKKTGELIPLAHNLPIEHIDIDFRFVGDNTIEIFSSVKYEGKTGVEMEAITAVMISALTIYDMSKAISKDIEIKDIKLIEKSGGKSGYYRKEGW